MSTVVGVLSAAVKDLLDICCEELGASSTVELAARAGERAIEACELHAGAIASVPYDQWAAMDSMHMWQFLWDEFANARPALFPGLRRAEDSAWELALRYAHIRGANLPVLSLTDVEAAQLSEARQALIGWTGLAELRPREPLVVGAECKAPYHATGTAQALLAPDLRQHILVHEDAIDFCRECKSKVSDLSLVLLHEEIHVALGELAGCETRDGWQLLAHAAEEALVTSLELAGEWWCWTHERPSRKD